MASKRTFEFTCKHCGQVNDVVIDVTDLPLPVSTPIEDKPDDVPLLGKRLRSLPVSEPLDD